MKKMVFGMCIAALLSGLTLSAAQNDRPMTQEELERALNGINAALHGAKKPKPWYKTPKRILGGLFFSGMAAYSAYMFYRFQHRARHGAQIQGGERLMDLTPDIKLPISYNNALRVVDTVSCALTAGAAVFSALCAARIAGIW